MLEEKMNKKEIKGEKITEIKQIKEIKEIADITEIKEVKNEKVELVENKSSSKLFGSSKVLSVEEKLLRLKLLDEKMSKGKNDDNKSKSSGGFSKDKIKD